MYDKLPTIRYISPQGFKEMSDITTTFRVWNTVIEEGAYPLNIPVQETDRPEIFADRVYGNSKMHWVILNLNRIQNPYYDWVLSPQSFENYMSEKYPGYTLFLTNVNGTEAFQGSFKVNDSIFVTGNTLASAQPSFSSELKNARVVSYDPAYCRLVVEFTQKSAWNPVAGEYIAGSNTDKNGTTTYYVARIGKAIESQYAVHHFENSDGQLLNPTLPSTMQNMYVSTTDLTGFTFGSTVLGRHILEGLNSFVITNREEEIEQNDDRRTVAVVNKKYLTNIMRDVETLVNAG